MFSLMLVSNRILLCLFQTGVKSFVTRTKSDLLGLRAGFLCGKHELLPLWSQDTCRSCCYNVSLFIAILSSVCLSVCLHLCGLFVAPQYITGHLVPSPRQLVMATECPEEGETSRLSRSLNGQQLKLVTHLLVIMY